MFDFKRVNQMPSKQRRQKYVGPFGAAYLHFESGTKITLELDTVRHQPLVFDF